MKINKYKNSMMANSLWYILLHHFIGIYFLIVSFEGAVAILLHGNECYQLESLNEVNQRFLDFYNEEISSNSNEFQQTFFTCGKKEYIGIWNEYLRHQHILQTEDSTDYILDNICYIDLLLQLFTSRATFLIQNKLEKHLVRKLSQCNQTNRISYNIVSVNLSLSSKKDIQQILLYEKADDITSFVMLGTWKFYVTILNAANVVDLLRPEYAWFISQSNLPSSRNFEFIPVNTIAFKRSHNEGFEGFTKLCIISAKWNITMSDMRYNSIRTHRQAGITKQIISNTVSQSLEVNTLNDRNEWHPIGFIMDNNITLNSNSFRLLSKFHSPQMFRKLKVVTIIDPPFAFIHKSLDIYDRVHKTCTVGKLCWKHSEHNISTNMEPHCCIGFTIDLLNLLEQDLGFSSELYIVQDSAYGAKVNGTWVGMVGDVSHGKADLAAAALTITEKRSEVVSFTDPFMDGGMSLLTVKKKSPLPFLNSEFLKPLSNDLWLITAVAMVIASIMLKITERNGVVPKEYEMRKTLLYINGLVFQRNIGGEEPTNFASRFTALIFAVAMMVIMSTYTAVLTATMVTHKTELPVTGFRDEKIVQPTPAFKYATVAKSSYTEMFRKSKDPTWNRMYYFMEQYNFKDTSKAIERIKTGELDAIMHDRQILLHFISKEWDCSLQIVGETISDAGYAFILKKDDPKKLRISELFRKFKQDGMIQRLIVKWTSSKCAPSSSSSGTLDGDSFQQTTISYFGGLFLALLTGCFVSAIILCWELYLERQNFLKIIKHESSILSSPVTSQKSTTRV